MNKGKKISVTALLSLSILFVATSAFAASIIVRNTFDRRLSLAFYYTDRSGEAVTQGWWYVSPSGETTVTLNADETRPIYYAAFNKSLFADSSTIKGPQVRGWLSYKKFVYSAGMEPDESNTFPSRFFNVPDSGFINVDASF